MYKLMILIPNPETLPDFFDQWPTFLRQAEQLPGLRREATSHIQHLLYGDADTSMIHELFFETLDILQLALASVQGKQAAGTLHQMTRGKVTLMIADHKEDDIENIRKFTTPAPKHDPSAA